jgi:hypothetical protein
MLSAFAGRQATGYVILESSELASMDYRNCCCRRCSFLARRQRGEAVIRTGFRGKPGMTCKDTGRKSRTYVIPDVTELAR